MSVNVVTSPASSGVKAFNLADKLFTKIALSDFDHTSQYQTTIQDLHNASESVYKGLAQLNPGRPPANFTDAQRLIRIKTITGLESEMVNTVLKLEGDLVDYAGTREDLEPKATQQYREALTKAASWSHVGATLLGLFPKA